MKVKHFFWIAAIFQGFVTVVHAQEAAIGPIQGQLREVYRELVEINTTDSSGSCTEAAQAMGARLRSAGLAAADVLVLSPPGGPKKGNLVARLRGNGAKKPLLLLAHIDVVEAKREDWKRDPFKLVEENGYFYARGASDDKAMAAAFVANLMRYRMEKYTPERDIVLALTCDEEIIPSPHNGVEYLLKNHRALLDAELALNEGGGGQLDKSGERVRLTIQAGEKVFQSYRLEVTNSGGHSAQPRRDNALYDLARGLARLGDFEFPAKLLPVTRASFARMAGILSGQVALDMKAVAAEPPDAGAIARLSRSPSYNAQLRTTCVATMADAGEATNSLPQRARAVVNCRVLPGESVAEVRSTLTRVLDNERISVTPMGDAVLSPPAPLDERILAPVQSIAAAMWPGVPLVPTMSAGATDSRFLNNAGIPTYGISGMFNEPETSGVHAVNERLPVRSLYEGQEFLYRLVKALSGGR
ncbi:MAG: M20/M25/M40 family metallo-hydrolase [Betaproteobacteria bacterium]|nr:M20/M25/M40 family metallo-hydrolase [Betaproteobacteria bacterium]